MPEWRNHPRLKGKFHPEYPDDIEIIIHDGGPRISNNRPELVWVRVAELQGKVFFGTVLNAPFHLENVKQGSTIKFLVPEGGQYPLMVTDKYLSERDNVIIHPCSKCGLTELFDVPSELYRAVFPDTPDDETWAKFTATCGACGGTLIVENKEVIYQR